MGEINFRLVGLLGIINISLLTVITLWRTARWYMSWEDVHTFSSFSFRKKLAFHVLLILTTLTDLPLYISFFVVQNYSLVTYSFHKLSSAFLFAALSITISDWAAVLHDIHEYKNYPWIFRRSGLFIVNAVYSCISFVNFILCYCSSSLDDYTASPVYVMTIFLQIFISFLLTYLMLHAGLKLYNRIQGAAGSLEPSSSNTKKTTSVNTPMTFPPLTRPPLTATEPALPPSLHRNQFASQFDGSAEFRSALRNLNLVMATCSICILVQMVMMIMNYALGFANSDSETVGPAVLYWTLNYWVPAWGPILALLYLSRTHSNRKKGGAKFNTLRLQTSGGDGEVGGGGVGVGGWGELHSPLIDPSDFSNLSGEAGLSSPVHERKRLADDASDRGEKRIDSPTHSNNTSAFLSANQNVLQSILSNNSFAQRRSNNSVRSSQRSSTRSGLTHPNGPASQHQYPPHDEEDAYSEHTAEDYAGEGGAGGYDDSLSYSIGAGYGGGYGGSGDTPDSSMLHHLMHMTSTPHSQSKTLARVKGVGEIRESDDSERSTGEVGGVVGGVGIGEESIRATTTTLPSDLYFPSIIRQAGGVEDFSYRGGDMHNGHYN